MATIKKYKELSKKIISKKIKDKLSENVKIIVAKPNLSQIVELD